MSTTHGQPGLSSDQRSTIRSTILSTRHTLEDELRRQLEKYGIYEDKKLPLENLTHLSVEEIHTRRTLDAAIERELESTEGDLERSITNYVREATKTYLNRFVALKTIEVRGLVEETITERPEYGNRSYMHHTVAEIAGELTNAPDDGFGAALDLAYQEIGAEIRMIFEETEHTAIGLDAQVREEVLDELDAIEDEAWKSDEALGWVYQYFGEEEREEIDDRVDEENYKIAGTDIATKTQLFTPRYIVEWMVDNSLGRTWLEMQGERTNIDTEENCFYLAPLEDSLIDRETKAVEDITVLDPACGSGHMLFYAFDVLYQMYLEEGEVPEKYIPREILRNNLFGVDIDSGSAQIAALSLYLKAKDQSPDVEIPQMNIISADTVLINGNQKQGVLNRAQSDLEEELFQQIWESFEKLRERGSLIQIEDKVDDLLEEYRETFETKGQAQFTQEGDITTQSTFVSGGEEETWEEVKVRLMDNVRELAEEALERDDPVEEMFAEEVGKSVELLGALLTEYDVVVSNPPYLPRGKMDKDLKEFVGDNYLGKPDLYGAFIERASQFIGQDGIAAMVTPENFMFTYYFRKLRGFMVENYPMVEGAHLSRYSFDQQKDVYTIPFTFRSKSTYKSPSRFYRMTHEQGEYETYEQKISGLVDIVNQQRQGKTHSDTYYADFNAFSTIDRSRFVYWFGNEILELFSSHTQVGTVADAMNGLQTGDNERFVRKWWEISEDDLDDYEWFVKSGGDQPYYDSCDNLVYWENDGEKIKSHSSSSVRNTEFYNQEGINFRDFSKHFTARLHTSDQIFSDTAHFVLPDDYDRHTLLGYLCSTLSRYLMDGLNPTLHFKVGDVESLPISKSLTESEIPELTSTGINKQRRIFGIDDSSPDFDPRWLIDNFEEILYYRDILKADLAVIHGKIDEIVFNEFGISNEVREKVTSEFPDSVLKYPLLETERDLGDFRDELNTRSNKVDNGETLKYIQDNIGESITDIARKMGVSPYSIADLRAINNLYDPDEKETVAAALLTHYMGEILGQKTPVRSAEGEREILPVTESSKKGTVEELKDRIESDFEDEEQIVKIIEQRLGTSIQSYLMNEFFESHHCKQYRRRGQRIPVYWQLESPGGAFSCFIYYHDINENTLPKLRGQNLDPRINELENELETLSAQTSGDDPDKELLQRKEKVQNDIGDIKEFRDTIDKMIDDGVTVDVEKGIWENIKEWDQYEVLETGLPKLKSSYSR